MKLEKITLTVLGRASSGTTIWRCNGFTASCTGNDEYGVVRCADKAIVALATTLKRPEITQFKKTLKEIADHHWTVTLEEVTP
jgi:hypothetical protein